MIQRRVIVFYPDYGGRNFLSNLFDQTVLFTPEIELTPDDMVLFEGGTDISPAIYNETAGRYTQRSDSRRDRFEVEIFKLAKEAGSSMFGICRGAQLFCALNEGTLIQHVSGHVGKEHFIQTSENERFKVPSVHHQMMAPSDKTPFTLLAWADRPQSKVYFNGEDADCFSKLDSVMGLEPEAIWWPETRCLGIQSHPEYVDEDHPLSQYCFKQIKKLIFKEKTE